VADVPSRLSLTPPRETLKEKEKTTQETKTQNKRRQTSMPLAEFEPMIPVFKRAKTFYALDRAVTVTGHFDGYTDLNSYFSIEAKFGNSTAL
jgi:hypothetical protein